MTRAVLESWVFDVLGYIPSEHTSLHAFLECHPSIIWKEYRQYLVTGEQDYKGQTIVKLLVLYSYYKDIGNCLHLILAQAT